MTDVSDLAGVGVRAPASRPAGSDRRMAEAISVLLIAGVGLSASVLVAGLALLAVTGRTGYHEALSTQLIIARDGTVVFPRTLVGVWQGLVQRKPFAVIEVGLLLVIATPVLRVAASVLLFARQGDRFYAGVTLVVLILLLLSLFWLR